MEKLAWFERAARFSRGDQDALRVADRAYVDKPCSLAPVLRNDLA